ncbi:MAG TPA: histidine kinase N-terminal domain-containing protein [Acidimicrobiales bacterium]|nr:histidine kinase N-terminal domain-containing protein [Acidimicrobiales bacterium]
MASIDDLARTTDLDGSALAHIQRLTASWGFLADLSFADLLLYVPEKAEVAEEPGAADGDGPVPPRRFVILAQMRPTTSQTLYREDQLGLVVDAGERPMVARAWQLGQIIDGDAVASPRSEAASVQCIPVYWKDCLLAIVTRVSAPSVGRRAGELERVYLDIFDAFARMIAAGEFPFGAEGTEPKDAPRVGDGVVRLDESGRVDFASPNFVSALHRMGVHANVLGARLGEVGFDEAPVRAAFAIGLPITEELERNDVTLLVRCIPLLDHGKVAGALALVRDVSELRRRDRLLVSKDVLIREMHHRVKNNLQTIASILNLQGRRLESSEAKEAIGESVQRIRAIALVHEKLSSGASAEVDFGDIAQSLVRYVEEGLVSPERRVELVVEGDPGPLRAEVATPLAVALTELLQNAVEHGYPDGWQSGKAGRVLVSFTNDGAELVVRVHDDGVGLAPDFSVDGPSLGLTIVRTLVTHELGGSITMSTDGGTLAELRLPIAAGTAGV